MRKPGLWPVDVERNGLVFTPRRAGVEPLELTHTDLARTRRILAAEHVDTTDESAIFRGLVYAALTRLSSYQRQKPALDRLLAKGLYTPKALAKRDTIEPLLSGLIYPGSLARDVRALARDWWPTDGATFVEDLATDVRTGYAHEYDLRKQLSQTCPGIGEKCASVFLRMSGYRDIVALDRWTIRFTRDFVGVRVKPAHDKGQVRRNGDYTRSPRHAEYARYEERFGDFARSFEIQPAVLQALLYAKQTSWSDERHPFLDGKRKA